jgi:hypothetical protein
MVDARYSLWKTLWERRPAAIYEERISFEILDLDPRWVDRSIPNCRIILSRSSIEERVSVT